MRKPDSMGRSLLSLGVWLCLAPMTVLAAERSSPAACAVTPTEDRLPSIIAPMAGDYPLWLVDVSGPFRGPGMPYNLYWVVARDHPGDLVVTGHRLDGEETASFMAGVYEPLEEQLLIENAHDQGMVPGGASAEIIQQYAFRGGYGLFPAPGCWELVAKMGETERRFVIELRP